MLVFDPTVSLEELYLSDNGHEEIEVLVCPALGILLEDLNHCLSKVDFAMLTANSGS